MAVSLIILSCNEAQKSSLKENSINTSDSSPKRSETYIDLKKFLEKKTDKDALTVQVAYDHYFKTSKKYKGFYINPILDSIVKANNFDTSNAIVIFECSDGYRPMMDFSKIYGKTKGYIVYKDLDQKSGKEWADSVYSKFVPSYLVWSDVKKEDQSFMWPYGLTGLRLISLHKEYKFVYPYKNSSAVNGFNLFRDNCMKCHSINKIGGTIGPEFNIPKNITEYWKEDDIISFAKNPGAYRFNSRMPQIKNLDDSAFAEIVQYLKYMKNNKLND